MEMIADLDIAEVLVLLSLLFVRMEVFHLPCTGCSSCILYVVE